MKTTNYKISDNLYLVQQQLATGDAPTVVVEKPVDLIVITDCSGSMAWDLPNVRAHLKRKLPKLLKEADTLSMIWFSGRKEYGVLFEKEPVATLTDLKAIETALDRWLKPCGLTGFKEPLEEAARLINRIKSPDRAISLFFQSDGCDNQWPQREVLTAVEALGGLVDSATFVEYGYYADRALLTKMAERCGGANVFAADFQQYVPTFDAAMQRKVSGAPKVQVEVGPALEGFAFATDVNELRTFAVEGSVINVPKDLKEVWYLSEKKLGNDETILLNRYFDNLASNNTAAINNGPMTAAYAALSLFAQRMNSNVVYGLLKASGDVRFIEKFANCFGKQKYTDFIETTTAAAWNPTFRLMGGYDPNKVPAEDAFTLLDLLQVLSNDESSKVLLGKPEFKYSKIGRGRIDSNVVLTEAEQEEIRKLTEDMAKYAKDGNKIKEISAKIAAISEPKQALVFKPTKEDAGYSLQTLTYNEDRPNISFLVKKEGVVDLSAKLDPKFDKVPAEFETYVYRNYAVIKDGLVNIETLPVDLSEGTFNLLNMNGVNVERVGDYQVINLKELPIVNRKMVKGVSAKELFSKEYELAVAQASQKVYNAYFKERFPKGASENLVSKYGQEAADWLKEQGFTHNGFAPKSVQAESTDVYLGKELKISLKGLSSLPTVKDVKDRIAKGKLTPSAALMAPAVKEVEDFLASSAYTNSTKQDELFKLWLESQTQAATRKVRGLISDLAKIKFSIVVGQTWPFPTLEENKYTLAVEGGGTIDCTIEQKEIEIKI